MKTNKASVKVSLNKLNWPRISAPKSVIHCVEAMVAGRMILKCLITVADMIRAEKTCCPSVAALNGETAVRRLPEQIVADLIEVPKHALDASADVLLLADALIVNEAPSFVPVTRNVKFTTTKNVLMRTAKQVVGAAKHMLTICSKRGFHVETVMMLDGEFALLKAGMLKMGMKKTRP
jgi:hypothetical protein